MKFAGRSLTEGRVHLVVLVAGVVAGLLLILAAAVNPYRSAPIYLLVYTPIEVAVGWTFLFVGLIAARRRPENRVGLLMSIFGLTWFAFLPEWILSPVPYYLGVMFSSVFLVVLGHLYIVYPRGRPAGKPERVAIVAIYVWFAVSTLATNLTNDSRQGCSRCLANPFLVPGTAPLNSSAVDFSNAGTVLVAAAVLGIFLWHWRQASPPVRRAMNPAAWAALPVFGVVVAGRLQNQGLVPDQVQVWLGPLEWVTFLILPLGLLIGVLRTRLSRAAVSDFVMELNRIPTRTTLRDSLAKALGDPSLELALALPSGEYVDAQGHPLLLPSPSSARAVTEIESDGRPIAALIHDPAVDEEDPGLVAAAGSAARLALENERLQAEVRASLEEVRASRARIVDAADAERKRLERDIHDGAQQRLVALGLALRLARDQAATHADDGLVRELDGAASQLMQALSELRGLAQGIHPAVLTRAGIGPALRVLAEVSPIPVEIKDTPPDRYREGVEAAVYFVVSEALTNAAKHSAAHRVEISVRHDGDRLVVEIRDDGLGGAAAGNGSGLTGMADRVAVLGGTLEIASPAQGGTLVHAEIPCE